MLPGWLPGGAQGCKGEDRPGLRWPGLFRGLAGLRRGATSKAAGRRRPSSFCAWVLMMSLCRGSAALAPTRRGIAIRSSPIRFTCCRV